MMTTFRYDPEVEPPADAWNAIDEGERSLIVRVWHDEAGVTAPNMRLHATFHVIVENQIAMGNETPVAQTVRRLMDEGLSRHDALHAVGDAMMKSMMSTMRDPTTTSAEPAYYDALTKLTAAAWLASGDEPGAPPPRPRRKRLRFRP
jgi:hypothetical protein